MISAAEFRRRVERAPINAFGSAIVDTAPDKAHRCRRRPRDSRRRRGPMHSDAPLRRRRRLRRRPPDLPEERRDAGRQPPTAELRQRRRQGHGDRPPLQGDRPLRQAPGWRTLRRPGHPGDYASYLLECLVYNVPNDRFAASQTLRHADCLRVPLERSPGGRRLYRVDGAERAVHALPSAARPDSDSATADGAACAGRSPAHRRPSRVPRASGDARSASGQAVARALRPLATANLP
jgi:hypothetical protein